MNDLRAMFEMCAEPFLQVTLYKPERPVTKQGTKEKLPPGLPEQQTQVADACKFAQALGWRVVSVWTDGQWPWVTHILFRNDPS